VGETHVAWRHGKGAPDVPSPLYHEGRVYAVTDAGLAVCLDAAGGEVLWQQRLAGTFSASPVLAGGLIFATAESGTTFVFGAGPKFERVARNALPDEMYASPAVAGRQLFLRGRHSLYCIAAGPADAATARRD
jgi:outer membrane protein assembly factor BamB